MGLQIGEIIPKKEITVSDLKGKTIAVDAFNILYQFLTTIRQPDGVPLQDSKGNITSHLSGLFYRNINLITEGVKLIYVFDGKAPELKGKTHDIRKEAKEEALEKYHTAKDEGDIDGMRKYAHAQTSLDAEKIAESKELLKAMGIAVIQAPGEGEAQASMIAKRSDVFGVISQDYDCLMFEAPHVIQNLGMAKRRKTASGFIEVFPQMITLQEVLQELHITQEQLICLGIVCGTDYNPGGVKGLGPKKSLKLIQEHGSCEKVFQFLKQSEKYEVDFDWKEIYEEIAKPNVDEKTEIIFPKVNQEKIKEILVKHEFSEQRIDKQLEKLTLLKEKAKQKTLF
jgi:flap endonuclease-1